MFAEKYQFFTRSHGIDEQEGVFYAINTQNRNVKPVLITETPIHELLSEKIKRRKAKNKEYMRPSAGSHQWVDFFEI